MVTESDVEHMDRSGLVAPQQQAALERAIRARVLCVHDGTATAGRRVETTRDVDRHDGRAPRAHLVDACDRLGGLAGRLAGGAGAKQSVDDHRRPGRARRGVHGRDRLGACTLGIVALGLAEGIDAHRAAGTRERAGHDPGIATVVAGAGEHECAALTQLGDLAEQQCRCRLAGRAHERVRLDARSERRRFTSDGLRRGRDPHAHELRLWA